MNRYFRFVLVLFVSTGPLWAGSAAVNQKNQVDPSSLQPMVSQQGAVTSLVVPQLQAQAGGSRIDFVNARPMELPQVLSRSAAAEEADLINALLSRTPEETPGPTGFSAGAVGNGTRNPVHLGAPQASLDSEEIAPEAVGFARVDQLGEPQASLDSGGIAPEASGSNNDPFSTARADLGSVATNTSYPYRAAGKLFFNIGSSTYVCSASLIKRGVIVTAAHCVASFGNRQFYSNWSFVPGYRNGVAPYGVWTGRTATILTSYYAGTDSCSTPGVVCQDDVAVITLNTSSAGGYPGTSTGWYGYGWNGYGFTASGLTHITQIGYPAGLDYGAMMERNDSHGFKSSSSSSNTIIGSAMDGGSSGGPWLVNFGITPVFNGTTAGDASMSNIVVGVTGWGYISPLPKEMGASPFLSGNIPVLVNSACANVPGACL